MHELAHLWLGATGVSGAVPENRIERFSNDVASNFLLPENEISGVGVRRNTDRKSAVNLITRFAEEILVSRSMVAYRLFRAGFLSEGMWRELVAQFDLERRQARTAQRERAREHEGGPNYYVVRRHRLGTALLRFVARNVSAGALTPTKASKVLGVKPRGVAPLLSGAVPSAQLA
jgi:Zn-dependent peptidase ImmA (M78 family)